MPGIATTLTPMVARGCHEKHQVAWAEKGGCLRLGHFVNQDRRMAGNYPVHPLHYRASVEKTSIVPSYYHSYQRIQCPDSAYYVEQTHTHRTKKKNNPFMQVMQHALADHSKLVTDKWSFNVPPTPRGLGSKPPWRPSMLLKSRLTLGKPAIPVAVAQVGWLLARGKPATVSVAPADPARYWKTGSCWSGACRPRRRRR